MLTESILLRGEQEGVLPDVDSRTPAAAGEKAAEGGGLGEGD